MKGCKTFDLPVELKGYRHVFHLYVIETKKPEWRDQLVDFLVKNGIDAKTHYSIAIHKQAGYPVGQAGPHRRQRRQRRGQRRHLHQPADVPRTDREEVDYVIAKVKEWDKQYAAQVPRQGPARAGECCCCK